MNRHEKEQMSEEERPQYEATLETTAESLNRFDPLDYYG